MTAPYSVMDVVLQNIDNLADWERMITWCSLPDSIHDHIHGRAQRPTDDREAERAFAKAAAEARAIVMSTLSPELRGRVEARLAMNLATAKTVVDMARRIVLTDVDYIETFSQFVSLDRHHFPSLAAFNHRMDCLWEILKAHHDRLSDELYINVGLKAIRCYHADVFETLSKKEDLNIGHIEYWLDFLAQTDDEFF
ncbi:ABC multidrug transporter [Purpureocillium lavendulum]|uniref:ABC multidrug transporter n=1 Tax=Purpureocillium lavendulum TaxID=1247861 RepID=A0AB34FHI4_9HYPO|nr:ABC multidrug transporter [Purpureocillium lavendulum]